MNRLDKNLEGFRGGCSGCFHCSDAWSWKTPFDIPVAPDKGCIPVCTDCAAILTVEEMLAYIDEIPWVTKEERGYAERWLRERKPSLKCVYCRLEIHEDDPPPRAGEPIAHRFRYRCAELLQAQQDTLRRKLKECEKGREHDREQFRHGVDAWQKRARKAAQRIRDLRAQRASDKDYIAQIENDAAYARGEWRKAKSLIQAAQDTIAKRLRNCAGNFHEENPNGCKGHCDGFGCETLRGIRDTLKE